MFFKNSRYYKLTDAAKQDASGRVFNSKQLRLLPTVVGTYQHIVDENDRLDNLAFKYYKKPTQWWKVCDANPKFYSPRSLLGKTPLKIIEIEVQWDGLQAPWFELKSELEAGVGIEKVILGTKDYNYPNAEVFDLGFLFSLDLALESDINDSILVQELTPVLTLAFQTEGHEFDGEIRFSKIESNHWQLINQNTREVFTIRLQTSVLNVFESQLHFVWHLTIKYNDKSISSSTIKSRIETIASPEFEVLSQIDIRQVGQAIIIPPQTINNGT